MVPNGWDRKSLAELCDKPVSYGIVQTGPRVEKGVPCLRVVDLTRREMSLGNMITTSPEIHQAYKRTTLEVGDIVMALRGEIGLAKLVDMKWLEQILQGGWLEFRQTQNVLSQNSFYGRYVLQTLELI